ncbi:NmrA-like family protein [Thozetella sp. PMI_491]|nr:NmrA-like family protein [Thozetella sp. PMI_491]
MSEIKNVALAGANGNLGAVLLKTLLADGSFNVTVIKRASSQSQPEAPPSVKLVEVSDAWTTEELTEALKGHDAAIACWPLRDVSQHIRFAEAAAAAGVRRFIPADYGSVDSRSLYAQQLVKLFDNKVKVRERLQELAAASGGAFSWTSLVNGHFFDWGLTNGFLHFYPDEKRAEILGDGKAKSSNATLGQISKGVVQIFKKLDETRDRVLMIQSFCVSQLDVLESLERITGEKYSADYVDIDEFVKKHKALADAGNRDSIEDLVFALGVIEGNWEEKEDFAMELLGLQNEDLDTVVKEALGK